LSAYGTPSRRAEFGLEDDFALLGGFIAGPATLAEFAKNAPVNTDEVEEPLLKVLRISPDFRPAYDPLLRRALAALANEGPLDADLP
jgi:spermidine synthase